MTPSNVTSKKKRVIGKHFCVNGPLRGEIEGLRRRQEHAAMSERRALIGRNRRWARGYSCLLCSLFGRLWTQGGERAADDAFVSSYLRNGEKTAAFVSTYITLPITAKGSDVPARSHLALSISFSSDTLFQTKNKNTCAQKEIKRKLHELLTHANIFACYLREASVFTLLR